jgi:hypothetical protein
MDDKSAKSVKSSKSTKSAKSAESSNTTTILDHAQDKPDGTCVVYKFRSRPPYEGFILILIIVLITALFIWWLNSKVS